MTCIAAVATDKGVWMGADSAGTDDFYSRTVIASSKVYVKENRNGTQFLIGACGSFRALQIVRYHVDLPNPEASQDPMEFMVRHFTETVRSKLSDYNYSMNEDNEESFYGEYLVAYHNQLFILQSDFGVVDTVESYAATGSGQDLALGALYVQPDSVSPKTRITKALEAASRFNAGVHPPFVIEHIPYEENV